MTEGWDSIKARHSQVAEDRMSIGYGSLDLPCSKCIPLPKMFHVSIHKAEEKDPVHLCESITQWNSHSVVMSNSGCKDALKKWLVLWPSLRLGSASILCDSTFQMSVAFLCKLSGLQWRSLSVCPAVTACASLSFLSFSRLPKCLMNSQPWNMTLATPVVSASIELLCIHGWVHMDWTRSIFSCLHSHPLSSPWESGSVGDSTILLPLLLLLSSGNPLLDALLSTRSTFSFCPLLCQVSAINPGLLQRLAAPLITCNTPTELVTMSWD